MWNKLKTHIITFTVFEDFFILYDNLKHIGEELKNKHIKILKSLSSHDLPKISHFDKVNYFQNN